MMKWLKKLFAKKMYRYFASYSHPHGFGNITLVTLLPIKNFDDIEAITKFILDQYPDLKKVAILNYKLMCKCRGRG